MSLKKQIQRDLHASIKNEDKVVTISLRLLLAAIKKNEIEKNNELTQSEIISITRTLVKQRKDSIDIYKKAGRDDLAKQETSELKVLSKFLPEMLSEEETRNIIENAINHLSADDISSIGEVMSIVMKNGFGKIDGKLANKIVKELLS